MNKWINEEAKKAGVNSSQLLKGFHINQDCNGCTKIWDMNTFRQKGSYRLEELNSVNESLKERKFNSCLLSTYSVSGTFGVWDMPDSCHHGAYIWAEGDK